MAGSRVRQRSRLSTDPSAVGPSAWSASTSWSQDGFQRTSSQLLKAASGAEWKEREGSPPPFLSPFRRRRSSSQKLPTRSSVCLLGGDSGTPSPLAAREMGRPSLWHPHPKSAPFRIPARGGKALLEKFPPPRASVDLQFCACIWRVP